MLRTIGTGEVAPDLAAVRGRAKITLALAQFESGRRDEAFALLDGAEQEASGPGSATVRTLAAIQRSGLHARLGEWDAALAVMIMIRDAAAAVGPRAAAVVALNAGLARQLLGDVAGSAAELARAERIASAAGIDDIAAAATHNLGRLEFVRGDLSRSLDLMTRARDMSDTLPRAQVDLDRARVLIEAGLLDDAVPLLAESEAVARSDHLVHYVGEITLERARLALVLGDHRAALDLARTAARSFARHREPAWQTQAKLLGLRAELALGRGSAAAVRRAVDLADGPAAASGVRAAAQLLAAEALADAGEVEESARRLAGVPSVARLAFPDRLHRYLVAVTVAAARGDRPAVRRQLRKAVATLAAEQGRYSGLDSRTAVALHGRRLIEIDLDHAVGPSAVFDACERWRGVSYRLPRVNPIDDPMINRLLVELRQARLELRDGGPEPPILARIARLEAAVRSRDWEISGVAGRGDDHRAVARPIRFAEARSALSRRRAGMISLFVYRGVLKSVTLSAAGGRVRELGGAADAAEHARRIAADVVALSRAVARLRPIIARSLARSMAALGHLLAPALPDTERVIILPTRVLASLPWRMLPQLAGRPVTVAPSATFWCRGLDAVPAAGRAMAAVAGPGLARAQEEAEAVARRWPAATTLSGAAATGANLAAALRDAAIVHVAAHGFHHDQSPLFSFVQLADGPVFAHDLQRCGVGAGHVVLSACEAGRARVRPGEESLGLTSALLACGVRSVVAAAAPVRDDLAARLMSEYHGLLSAGIDAAEALERSSRGDPDSRLFCNYGSDWAPAQSTAVAEA
ncbi:CHAT domain-containing protein [Microlunatus parietis]|uniref:Tetratricopeptide (TPR) repeat protein n=1 Tax=Microlunatus parietis TaxID=682979 RepID=A0A7Y9LB93_9ACTN|nr:tetratricopeptide (TPR) repeat protein [Microlunatus parietis]